MSLINALSSKWKRGGKLIDLNNCQEFKQAGQSLFRFRIGIPGVLTGEATDTTKQRAKALAAQSFLKEFFPRGYTWNMVQRIIQEKGGSELAEILEQRDALIP